MKHEPRQPFIPMKPTPRTNAEIISTSKKTIAIVVSDNFARQLERELNNANDEITRLKEILAMQHFRKDKRAAAMPNVES